MLQAPRAVSPHLLAFFSFSRPSGFSTHDEHEGEFFLGEGEGNGKAQATILGKVVLMEKKQRIRLEERVGTGGMLLSLLSCCTCCLVDVAVHHSTSLYLT